METTWFKKSLHGVLEVFDTQISNKDSDIVGEADVQGAAKIIVSDIDGIEAGLKRIL